jgi:hypothetical protein
MSDECDIAMRRGNIAEVSEWRIALIAEADSVLI